MCAVRSLQSPHQPGFAVKALQPRDAEVRSALECIARSSHFRSSPKLTAFLRYIVGRTLAGRSAEIKGYTIAVESLGRRPSFDPQTDPIVRVEAGRLRHALSHYYAGDGSDDAVIIGLTRGSYVPLFHHRTAAADADRAQYLFARLAALRRQLEIVSAEIERAWKELERSARRPRRHD
jgi:hypothetical protein